MNPRERGFALLASHLGDPGRRPLTAPQLRVLARRAAEMERNDPDRDLTAGDLMALGYGREMAAHIVDLLDQEDVLDHYLTRGRRAGCVPITRVSPEYPLLLRKNLGLDSPGILWAKGDFSLLNTPAVALVGSRDLNPDNRKFAGEAGRQAALQGLTLVSGNARGADRTAQEAALEAGGAVISIVSDELAKQPLRENVLYLSEDGFEEPFSAMRALSRNRCIHAMVWRTFVAQTGSGTGGTWDGTVKNLRAGWSGVYCFDDGSEGMERLITMGALPVGLDDLKDFSALPEKEKSFFDR